MSDSTFARPLADAEGQARSARVSPAPATHLAPVTMPAPSAGTPTSSGLRFRVLQPHAKGGLGEVFVVMAAVILGAATVLLAAVQGEVLLRGGGDAVPLLRQAQQRHPDDFWLNLWSGEVLVAAQQRGEAVGHYERALRLDPKDAKAHVVLGLALAEQGKVAEAVGHFEQALRLDPKLPQAHNNLGAALHKQGKVAEAVSHFKQALRLDPKFAPAHNNLGVALKEQGKVAEAVSHYEQALRLDPKHAKAHTNLGAILAEQGKVAEAVGHYEQALRLDPKHALAHNNLGLALYGQGKVAEAVGHFEQAIRLDPEYAAAHYNLGSVLYEQGKVAEAVGHFERALRLDPKHAKAHAALGLALLELGRWAEARVATRRCLDLLPQRDPLRARVQRQLRQCERMLALAGRLPAVLAGKDRPSGAAEALEFAALCRATKRYAAAARFYADAFAAQPELADDLRTGHRYDAACYAALASCGEGQDAPKAEDKERARWRQQALAWLRADLALRGKQAESGKAADRADVRAKLRHWQRDPDLTGVRDAVALAKLPEAERVEWEKLWADVAALLKKAETGGKN